VGSFSSTDTPLTSRNSLFPGNSPRGGVTELKFLRFLFQTPILVFISLMPNFSPSYSYYIFAIHKQFSKRPNFEPAPELADIKRHGGQPERVVKVGQFWLCYSRFQKYSIQKMCYNSTKTDRPRLPLLVGPHAALCKPNQGAAQLRLSLNHAAPPRLRQLPDELSPPPRSLSSARKRALEIMSNFTQAASLDERMRLNLEIQRWPRTGIPGRATNQDLQETQNWVC
jgi:hypothetical protein